MLSSSSHISGVLSFNTESICTRAVCLVPVECSFTSWGYGSAGRRMLTAVRLHGCLALAVCCRCGDTAEVGVVVGAGAGAGADPGGEQV